MTESKMSTPLGNSTTLGFTLLGACFYPLHENRVRVNRSLPNGLNLSNCYVLYIVLNTQFAICYFSIV